MSVRFARKRIGTVVESVHRQTIGSCNVDWGNIPMGARSGLDASFISAGILKGAGSPRGDYAQV